MPSSRPWPSTLARLVLGSAFLVAAIPKLTDLREAELAVSAYRLIPYSAARTVGASLSFLEVALTALLLLGVAIRLAAVVSILVLVTFMVAIISVWARGISIDCGCFGGGGTVSHGAVTGYVRDLLRDLALLGTACLLVWRPQTRFALDQRILTPRGTKR